MNSFQAFQMGLLALLIGAVAAPVPGCWRICRRAGYSGWFSLVIFIPIINAVAIYWLAYHRPGGSPTLASRQPVEPVSGFRVPGHGRGLRRMAELT